MIVINFYKIVIWNIFRYFFVPIKITVFGFLQAACSPPPLQIFTGRHWKLSNADMLKKATPAMNSDRSAQIGESNDTSRAWKRNWASVSERNKCNGWLVTYGAGGCGGNGRYGPRSVAQPVNRSRQSVVGRTRPCEAVLHRYRAGFGRTNKGRFLKKYFNYRCYLCVKYVPMDCAICSGIKYTTKKSSIATFSKTKIFINVYYINTFIES